MRILDQRLKGDGHRATKKSELKARKATAGTVVGASGAVTPDAKDAWPRPASKVKGKDKTKGKDKGKKAGGKLAKAAAGEAEADAGKLGQQGLRRRS
ncbi:MAG: hypothetical protein MZW92_74340 [Comamonadaceae bacterium]|nr:hypothetical protein [Comamonadaceae bacterium]